MDSAVDRKRVLKVLVVDDDEQVRVLFLRILRGRCHAVGAVDGPDALEALFRETPDVIVTDYDMPGMKGTELCRRVRLHPALRRVKIVLISGSLTEQLGETARLAGADHVLAKPLETESLLKVLGLPE